MNNTNRFDIFIIIFIAIVLFGLVVSFLVFGGSSPSSSPIDAVDLMARGLAFEDAPLLGEKEAPATIVEFGDFQCIACVQFFALIEPQLRERFVDTGKANIVFKPIAFIDRGSSLRESHLAGEAALCAQDQGAFWEMHDAIYQAESDEVTQNKTQENSGNLTRDFFSSVANKSGIDTQQFLSCLDEGEKSDLLDEYMGDANRALDGRVATPSVFVIKDGAAYKIQNPFDIREYENIIGS